MMSWLWGSSKNRNDDDDEYDDEDDSDEYTDDEDDEDTEEGDEEGDEDEDEDGVVVEQESHKGAASAPNEKETVNAGNDTPMGPGDSPTKKKKDRSVSVMTPPRGNVRNESIQSTTDTNETVVVAEDDPQVDWAVQEQVMKGEIPSSVDVSHKGLRDRLPSALTISAPDDEDEEDQGDEEEDYDNVQEFFDEADEDDEDEEEEEEQVTSTAEKQSLLLLAAEHDRVDILNAILTDDATDRDTLLFGGIPPLHIAVSYGSTNATNALLRMGADPSQRPNVKEIQNQSTGGPVEIPNMNKYDGASAWELAFGDGTKAEKKSGWSLFGGSGDDTAEETTDDANDSAGKKGKSRRKSVQAVDMPPSKRESIRHAFTAEALRCIGNDELHRLQQLVAAGMPEDISIGDKGLYDWCVEMGALKCEEFLRPAVAAKHNGSSDSNENDDTQPSTATGTTTSTNATATSGIDSMRKTSILDQANSSTKEETVLQLKNRLDEVQLLGQSLSTLLDGLAEEVSVCSGLLLAGSGGAALASFVKSLKTKKETKLEDLSRMEDSWENCQDELAYWVRQAKINGYAKELDTITQMSHSVMTIKEEEEGDDDTKEGGSKSDAQKEENEQKKRQLLKGQIAAMEHKVLKLRSSIADLSEENDRNLKEVARRGLSGGVKLVRGLREEIREIDFQIAELQNAEGSNRTKITLIQQRLASVAKKDNGNAEGVTARGILPSLPETTELPQQSTELKATSSREIVAPAKAVEPPKAELGVATTDKTKTDSKKIQGGDSTALTVRGEGPRGTIATSLWNILLRIIGIRSNAVLHPTGTNNMSTSDTNSSSSTPVMII